MFDRNDTGRFQEGKTLDDDLKNLRELLIKKSELEAQIAEKSAMSDQEGLLLFGPDYFTQLATAEARLKDYEGSVEQLTQKVKDYLKLQAGKAAGAGENPSFVSQGQRDIESDIAKTVEAIRVEGLKAQMVGKTAAQQEELNKQLFISQELYKQSAEIAEIGEESPRGSRLVSAIEAAASAYFEAQQAVKELAEKDAAQQGLLANNRDLSARIGELKTEQAAIGRST